MAHILSGEESKRGKEEKADLLLTDDSTFVNAKKAFVEKLQGMAESDPSKLISNIHLVDLLYRWKEWGDLKHIQAWLINNITSYEKLLAFLEKFTSRVVSQGVGDFVARVKYRMNLGNLETFFPLDNIKELLKTGDEESLNERQRQVMDALETAFKRRENGYADDAWDDD